MTSFLLARGKFAAEALSALRWRLCKQTESHPQKHFREVLGKSKKKKKKATHNAFQILILSSKEFFFWKRGFVLLYRKKVLGNFLWPFGGVPFSSARVAEKCYFWFW